MKKLIEIIKNIWSIEDLRVRILNTLGFILIYRLGSYIVLPGVDPSRLANSGHEAEGIVGLINIFAGGAFSRASVFGLGIMPYISASIVIQLLSMAIPYFQKLQKEGESGRKKINQYTRMLTIVVTILQAPGYIASQIIPHIGPQGFYFYFQSTLILVTGTMFVMWLGERITDKGIGNGISLLIMVGIVARLPFAIIAEFGQRLESTGGGLIIFLVEIV
ncbi:MAG: preprotein translocase subunit SecY, partial [Bacteroidetes bacterium]|nr:preprotein translocase subunit SecY [Bacteroidota bacterium]